MRSPLRSLLLASIVMATAACSTTIVEPFESASTSPPTTAPPAVPTTTDDILAALHAEMGTLSEVVVQTGGPRAFDQLDEIEGLWKRVQPTIASQHPELLADFERMMAWCRLAVERRRPADADKAYAFMTPLLAALSDRS